MELSAAPMPPGAGRLACAAVVLIIGACGGSPRGNMTKASPGPDANDQMVPTRTFADPHEEIDYLYGEISTLRRTSGMAEMPPVEYTDPPEIMPRPMAHGATYDDTCRDVCTLATSICDNAQRICHLAEGLAPDDWSAEKCASADTSCTEANDNCTECNGND